MINKYEIYAFFRFIDKNEESRERDQLRQQRHKDRAKSLSVYPQRAFPVRERRNSINVSLILVKEWTVVTDTTMSITFMTSHGKMAILSLRTFIVLARISIKTRMGTIWRNWLRQTGENLLVLFVVIF